MGAHLMGRVIESPETLRLGDGTHLVRIDDPLADRLAKGDPIFGWEGDNRYVLYVNHRRKRFELWRHEDDGVMRFNIAVPGFVPAPDVVAWLITWIVGNDSRRGHDPLAQAFAQMAEHEAAVAAAADEHAEDSADHLHHALLKDIGHIEAGVTHRLYPSAAVTAAPDVAAPADASDQGAPPQ